MTAPTTPPNNSAPAPVFRRALSPGVAKAVAGGKKPLPDSANAPPPKAIPIAPSAEDPAAYEAAAKVLREGDLLCIFPEGGITKDGTLQPFKGGIMKILGNAERDGVTAPVVPMALTNLWGSFFSRVEKDGAMVRPFRRGMFSRVDLNVGAAVQPADVQPATLHGSVAKLMVA